MTEIYTRAQYLADSKQRGPEATAAHRRYFGQFVTSGTKRRVLSAIWEARLLAARDPHLNDIPLGMWDRLTPQLPGSTGFAKAGDYYTMANGVCLAKEAARQIIEAQPQEASQ